MTKTCVVFPVCHAPMCFLNYKSNEYFARDIVNLDSKTFKEASKEAQKLCHIVLWAFIWGRMSEKK